MAAVTRSIAPVGACLLVLLVVPGRAVAQSRVQVKPALTVGQMFDDNLFATSAGREADDIWRLSPSLGLRRLSRRLTLLARYAVDAEVFRNHPELNSAAASQRAALDVLWMPSRSLTTAIEASYASARAPGELNTLTGLQAGRLEARRLSTKESLSRRLGSLSKMTLEHSFTREQVVGRPDVDTQVLTAGWERRLGPRNRGRLGYSARRFVFGGQTIESQVATLGWAGDLTSRAHFELEAGPRRTGNVIGAEVSATLKRRFRTGDALLAYLHTQTTALGEPAPVRAEGVTATFTRQLGRVRLSGGPSFFRIRGQASESTVRRLGSECAWRMTRRIALTLSHELSIQRGGVGRVGDAGTEIAHNRLVVSLAAGSAAH